MQNSKENTNQRFTVTVGVKMPISLRLSIEKIAELNDKSLSRVCRDIIEKYIDGKDASGTKKINAKNALEKLDECKKSFAKNAENIRQIKNTFESLLDKKNSDGNPIISDQMSIRLLKTILNYLAKNQDGLNELLAFFGDEKIQIVQPLSSGSRIDLLVEDADPVEVRTSMKEEDGEEYDGKKLGQVEQLPAIYTHMIKVQLIGKILGDAKVSTTEQGVEEYSFRIIAQQETQGFVKNHYIDVRIPVAEVRDAIKPHLAKGVLVYVSGGFDSYAVEKNNDRGEKKTYINEICFADDIKILS